MYVPRISVIAMIGGIIRLFFDKMKREEGEKKAIINDGILFCSGMIAGEGLVGIVLALLAVVGYDKFVDISKFINLPEPLASISGLFVFALVIVSLLMFTVWKKRKASK